MTPSKQEIRFAPAYAAELLIIAEGDLATAIALKNVSGIRDCSGQNQKDARLGAGIKAI